MNVCGELAKKENISINHLVMLALAEKVKRGSRAKFDQAMAKVADIEPPEFDRL